MEIEDAEIKIKIKIENIDEFNQIIDNLKNDIQKLNNFELKLKTD